MSADQWHAPDDWHLTVAALSPDYVLPQPVVEWPRDGVIALLTTAFVALTGPVVGLIWSATSPKLSVRQVALGAESPFKTQIGADGRFLLISVVAGIVCAALVLLLRQHGPGVVVGLAVGGLLAALVAARVGSIAEHHATIVALRNVGLPPTHRLVHLLDFRVRALGVLVAWPIAAVVAHGLAVALRPHSR